MAKPIRVFIYAVALSMAALFLCAGLCLWIESNGGKTLIHDIPVEISESSYIPGRIYRPVVAQSLNLRPTVLIFEHNDTINESRKIAIEFSRRGFVALCIPNKIISIEKNAPIVSISERLDNSLLFLQAQPFVADDRIGLITLNEPQEITIPQFSTNEMLFSPISAKKIETTLSALNQRLKIKNDSPLWFDEKEQLAQLYEILNIIKNIAIFFIGFLILIFVFIIVLSQLKKRNLS